MAIEEIQIVPTNGKEISFIGEVIAHATSEPTITSFGEHCFDLRIYKLVEHGLVPVIEYLSTVDGEENVTIAERVDRSHDIENFFYVFEPCEVISESALKVLPIEERQRLKKTVLKHYDAQVNRILLQAKEHLTDDEPDVSAPPKEEKGLLRFFRQKD